jgi:hypothetical protein
MPVMLPLIAGSMVYPVIKETVPQALSAEFLSENMASISMTSVITVGTSCWLFGLSVASMPAIVGGIGLGYVLSEYMTPIIQDNIPEIISSNQYVSSAVSILLPPLATGIIAVNPQLLYRGLSTVTFSYFIIDEIDKYINGNDAQCQSIAVFSTKIVAAGVMSPVTYKVSSLAMIAFPHVVSLSLGVFVGATGFVLIANYQQGHSDVYSAIVGGGLLLTSPAGLYGYMKGVAIIQNIPLAYSIGIISGPILDYALEYHKEGDALKTEKFLAKRVPNVQELVTNSLAEALSESLLLAKLVQHMGNHPAGRTLSRDISKTPGIYENACQRAYFGGTPYVYDVSVLLQVLSKSVCKGTFVGAGLAVLGTKSVEGTARIANFPCDLLGRYFIITGQAWQDSSDYNKTAYQSINDINPISRYHQCNKMLLTQFEDYKNFLASHSAEWHYGQLIDAGGESIPKNLVMDVIGSQVSNFKIDSGLNNLATQAKAKTAIGNWFDVISGLVIDVTAKFTAVALKTEILSPPARVIQDAMHQNHVTENICAIVYNEANELFERWNTEICILGDDQNPNINLV